MSHNEPTHADQMKSKAGMSRIFKALVYSKQGLVAAWRDEHAFRQELFAVMPLALVAILLDVPPVQKAMLLGSLLLILIVELINSSIEAAVDLVTRHHAPLAGKAKDIGSAAVFLCMVNAVVIWGLVLWAQYGHAAGR